MGDNVSAIKNNSVILGTSTSTTLAKESLARLIRGVYFCVGTLGDEITINSPDFNAVIFAKALEERTPKTNDDVAIIRKEIETLEEKIEEIYSKNKR
ncbi:MAG: hypothetical protein MUF45_16010, partial [Spirosomaceae bacterium]|nr:hypothetical protein [Spirosomataceae bacterium]